VRLRIAKVVLTSPIARPLLLSSVQIGHKGAASPLVFSEKVKKPGPFNSFLRPPATCRAM